MTDVDFGTVSFLAPAQRVDLFGQRLLPLFGTRIRSSAIFTMSDFAEQNDVCGINSHLTPYHKSLLYLIYKALERYEPYDILGVQICLEKYPELMDAYGLTQGEINSVGQVIFSPTAASAGRSASRAIQHGAFD